MIKTALFPLLTLALAAQTPALETKKDTPKPVAQAGVTPKAEAAPKKEDKILAKVGNRIIRESDMEFALEGLNPQERQRLEQAPGGRERYAKQFVELFILSAKARKDGLDKAAGFDKKLALATDQLLANELMRKDAPGLQAKLTLSDDDLKKYFEEHKDVFKEKDKFSARHILISTKGGPGGDKGLSDEDAKAKAAKVQEEFKKGRKWEELAKEFSEDPGSKEKGGLYENIAFGQFVKEFEDAVRKQEIGKVGEPVKSQFGYHVIQVEKITPSVAPEFEKVKDQVRQRAMPGRQEQVWNEYLDAAKKDIKVEMGSDVKTASSDAAPKAKTPAPKAPAAKKAQGTAK